MTSAHTLPDTRHVCTDAAMHIYFFIVRSDRSLVDGRSFHAVSENVVETATQEAMAWWSSTASRVPVVAAICSAHDSTSNTYT